MRLAVLVLVSCLILPVVSVAAAAEDRIVGLKSLTTERIDSQSARATIDLSSTSQHFRGFRLKAGAMRGRSRVTIRQVSVYYDDGRVYRTRRRIRLRPGQSSDLIDRRREGRFVERMEIEFIQTQAAGFQEIEVLGLQSLYDQRARRAGQALAGNEVTATPSATAVPDTGTPIVGESAIIERPGDRAADAGRPPIPESMRPEPMEPPPPSRAARGDTQPAGDVLFGVHYVGFGLDTDVIEVGRQVGKFARVRLRVLDNDIFLEGFKLHVTGGGTQDFKVGDKIDRGDQTDWFDIERNAFVDRIELSYRSRPDFRASTVRSSISM